MKKVGSVTVAAIASMWLFTGCSDTGDDPGDTGAGAPTPAAAGTAAPPDGGPDPCGLLTEPEVAAAAGADVTDTAGPVEELMGTQCEWFLPGDEFGEGQVTVSVWVGLDFYSPEAPGAQATGFEPVDGIGDVAHQWPPLDGICTVIFRSGEVVVQVLGLTTVEDACVDLARIAAGRV